MSRRTVMRSGAGTGALSVLLGALSSSGAASSHEVSVDLASTEHPVTHDASGLLYGLSEDGSSPGDEWLEPMDHGLQVGGGARVGDGGWATGTAYADRWNMVEGQYQRVTTPPHDAEYCIRMSDLWGADATQADSDPHPGDDGDWSSYYDFLDQVLADIDAAGMDRSEIQYEIWNEPDLDLFWPRSRSQYWEMWERGVDHIRSNHPNARIVGPGHTHFDSSMMEAWLDMTIDTGTEPDILNWHDLQTDDDAVTAANEIRDLLSARGMGDIPLEINEYVPQDRETPGYTAWDLARVEKADVDYAALANWQYCCSTPALCATLTQDGTQPTSRWWLYERYGGTQGDVVTTVGSGSVDAAANINPEETRSRIVLGNDGGQSGQVEVTIQNVDQIGDSVGIEVERLPDQEPLSSPIVEQDDVVDVTGGAHTVSLDWSDPTDAFVITVTPSDGSDDSGATIADGTYSIEAVHSGQVLDVAGQSTDDGANIRQSTYGGGDNQHFTVEHVGDDVYRIENVNSGKVLDVEGLSTDDGANVFQWEDLGGDNQRWSIEETSTDVYRVEAVHSGKVLDVEGISTDDGANVHQWEDLGGDNQRWYFNPV